MRLVSYLAALIKQFVRKRKRILCYIDLGKTHQIDTCSEKKEAGRREGKVVFLVLMMMVIYHTDWSRSRYGRGFKEDKSHDEDASEIDQDHFFSVRWQKWF